MYSLISLYCFLLTKQALFPLLEMSFLEQGDGLLWPAPVVSTSSERICGKPGAKSSPRTKQEAAEEGEPPGLGEGEAKVPSGEVGASVSDPPT